MYLRCMDVLSEQVCAPNGCLVLLDPLGYKHIYGNWDSNSGLLKEQPVLLTIKASSIPSIWVLNIPQQERIHT